MERGEEGGTEGGGAGGREAGRGGGRQGGRTGGGTEERREGTFDAEGAGSAHEHAVKFGAVDHQVGGTVGLLAERQHGLAAELVALVRAQNEGVRLHRALADLVQHAEALQDAGRVWGDLDSCAHLSSRSPRFSSRSRRPQRWRGEEERGEVAPRRALRLARRW